MRKYIDSVTPGADGAWYYASSFFRLKLEPVTLTFADPHNSPHVDYYGDVFRRDDEGHWYYLEGPCEIKNCPRDGSEVEWSNGTKIVCDYHAPIREDY